MRKATSFLVLVSCILLRLHGSRSETDYNSPITEIETREFKDIKETDHHPNEMAVKNEDSESNLMNADSSPDPPEEVFEQRTTEDRSATRSMRRLTRGRMPKSRKERRTYVSEQRAVQTRSSSRRSIERRVRRVRTERKRHLDVKRSRQRNQSMGNANVEFRRTVVGVRKTERRRMEARRTVPTDRRVEARRTVRIGGRVEARRTVRIGVRVETRRTETHTRQDAGTRNKVRRVDVRGVNMNNNRQRVSGSRADQRRVTLLSRRQRVNRSESRQRQNRDSKIRRQRFARRSRIYDIRSQRLVTSRRNFVADLSQGRRSEVRHHLDSTRRSSDVNRRTRTQANGRRTRKSREAVTEAAESIASSSDVPTGEASTPVVYKRTNRRAINRRQKTTEKVNKTRRLGARTSKRSNYERRRISIRVGDTTRRNIQRFTRNGRKMVQNVSAVRDTRQRSARTDRRRVTTVAGASRESRRQGRVANRRLTLAGATTQRIISQTRLYRTHAVRVARTTAQRVPSGRRVYRTNATRRSRRARVSRHRSLVTDKTIEYGVSPNDLTVTESTIGSRHTTIFVRHTRRATASRRAQIKRRRNRSSTKRTTQIIVPTDKTIGKVGENNPAPSTYTQVEHNSVATANDTTCDREMCSQPSILNPGKQLSHNGLKFGETAPEALIPVKIETHMNTIVAVKRMESVTGMLDVDGLTRTAIVGCAFLLTNNAIKYRP